MKKHIVLLFLTAVLSIAACGCTKKEQESITIPDTVIENVESITEETTVTDEPVIENTVVDESVTEETVPEISVTEDEYPAWYDLYDYHKDQPDLAADGDFKNLTIQVGRRADQLYITWFSKSSSQGQVTFKSENGSAPEISANATTEPSISVPGYYRNSAHIDDLEANTVYYYTLKNGSTQSTAYKYETNDLHSTNFTFTIAGDPELGLGDPEVLPEHQSIWRVVLNRMKEQIPDSSFLITTGDQVADPSSTIQYDAFLDNSLLYSTALVPLVGNHDNGTGFFGDHFTLPNLNSLGTESGRDGNYWFRRGNVLFIVLNSSCPMPFDDHEEFVRNVTRSNPDAKWKILLSHYSPITVVERYQGIRESIAEDYAELGLKYDIDLFIGGHDHVYTRGHFLDDEGDPIETSEPLSSEYHNPGQPIYMIVNSATNALLREPDSYPWSALSVQNGVPQLTEVQVTEDSIRVITRDADHWTLVDDFTICKD